MTISRIRWLVVAAAALMLLPELSNRDLWEPDEPRLGMVAEEMRSMRHGASGLVLLHLSGEPYTEKPPLYYWLASLAGAPGGRVTEWAARIPSALSGVAVVALTMALGARLLGAPTGALGAALLLSIFSFAELARRAQFDVLLTFFELVALVSFWRWERGIGRRAVNLTLAHGAMGLAVLTKGPVGLLVPLLCFAGYLGWERRIGALRRFVPPWALLLSVGPGLAWLAGAVALAPSGFFGEAVGTNLFGRFFAGTSHERPFYYYVYMFPLEFLPWTLLWPLVWWAGRRNVFAATGDPERRRAWRLLLAWVGGALLFFSLSSGKRGLYLLPSFPAAALLCADALVQWTRARGALPRWLGPVAAGFGLVFAAAGIALRVRPDLARVELPWTVPAALLLAVGVTSAAWFGLGRRGASQLARFAALVGGVLAIELTVFTQAFPALEGTKSPRPIAEAAAALIGPTERIGLFGSRPKLGGIAYYGGRDVVYLAGPDDVRGFLESGGRVLVLEADKLDRLRDATPVDVRAELREGRRGWVVVSPSDGAAQAPLPG